MYGSVQAAVEAYRKEVRRILPVEHSFPRHGTLVSSAWHSRFLAWHNRFLSMAQLCHRSVIFVALAAGTERMLVASVFFCKKMDNI